MERSDAPIPDGLDPDPKKWDWNRGVWIGSGDFLERYVDRILYSGAERADRDDIVKQTLIIAVRRHMGGWVPENPEHWCNFLRAVARRQRYLMYLKRLRDIEATPRRKLPPDASFPRRRGEFQPVPEEARKEIFYPPAQESAEDREILVQQAQPVCRDVIRFFEDGYKARRWDDTCLRIAWRKLLEVEPWEAMAQAWTPDADLRGDDGFRREANRLKQAWSRGLGRFLAEQPTTPSCAATAELIDSCFKTIADQQTTRELIVEILDRFLRPPANVGSSDLKPFICAAHALCWDVIRFFEDGCTEGRWDDTCLRIARFKLVGLRIARRELVGREGWLALAQTWLPWATAQKRTHVEFERQADRLRQAWSIGLHRFVEKQPPPPSWAQTPEMIRLCFEFLAGLRDDHES